jgi:hypothetical protein
MIHTTCWSKIFVLDGPAHRGTIGANSILGDKRWAGDYGIEADFWAHDNCRVIIDIVSNHTVFQLVTVSAPLPFPQKLLEKTCYIYNN